MNLPWQAWLALAAGAGLAYIGKLWRDRAEAARVLLSSSKLTSAVAEAATRARVDTGVANATLEAAHARVRVIDSTMTDPKVRLEEKLKLWNALKKDGHV